MRSPRWPDIALQLVSTAARVPERPRTAQAVLADIAAVAARLDDADASYQAAPTAARAVLTETLQVVHANLDPVFVGRQQHTPYMKALACAAIAVRCAACHEPRFAGPGGVLAHVEADLRLRDQPGDGRASAAALAGHAEQLTRLLDPDSIGDPELQARAIAAVSVHVAVNATQHARAAGHR